MQSLPFVQAIIAGLNRSAFDEIFRWYAEPRSECSDGRETTRAKKRNQISNSSQRMSWMSMMMKMLLLPYYCHLFWLVLLLLALLIDSMLMSPLMSPLGFRWPTNRGDNPENERSDTTNKGGTTRLSFKMVWIITIGRLKRLLRLVPSICPRDSSSPI